MLALFGALSPHGAFSRLTMDRGQRGHLGNKKYRSKWREALTHQALLAIK
jgi:hypothetical protein